MKHILFYCLVIIVAITSCGPEPIENYKGGIIYEKESYMIGQSVVIGIQNTNKKYEFKKIRILELDYNKYKVGDTIK